MLLFLSYLKRSLGAASPHPTRHSHPTYSCSLTCVPSLSTCYASAKVNVFWSHQHLLPTSHIHGISFTSSPPTPIHLHLNSIYFQVSALPSCLLGKLS